MLQRYKKFAKYETFFCFSPHNKKRKVCWPSFFVGKNLGGPKATKVKEVYFTTVTRFTLTPLSVLIRTVYTPALYWPRCNWVLSPWMSAS